MPERADSADRPPEVPNVLLVMSDQHHQRIMGCAGDALSPTPNLDRLAARGVRFTSAHCPYPLCCPSRMAFMTSRQPHDIGCLTNHSQLAGDEATFAHGFARAGYETVIAGRMHFVGYDQQHGFQKRIIGDVAPSAHLRGRAWGLEQVLGPTIVHATGSGPKVLRLSGPGVQGYQVFDEAVVAAADDWLRRRKPDDKPFLLTVGTVLPHCPFVAPPEDFHHFYERISVDDLPDPRLDTLPPPLRDLRRQWKLEDDPVDRETQRVVRAAYYGLVRFLDRLIGRLLDTLRHTGLDRNTLVLYTSDHGEQLGEHGLWWKSTFYQGSVGVPLIASLPGRLPEGKVVGGNVCLTDIGPTLLDVVGAAPLLSATGRSFRRLLETGDDPDWPDTVWSQYCVGNPVGRMVRRGPWKLMYYDGYEPILFNLDDDPGEFVNRAGDRACAPVLSELMALTTADGWSIPEIRRQNARETEGQRLYAQWLQTTDPPEPHPPWFGNTPPVNRLDEIPGSPHRPPAT